MVVPEREIVSSPVMVMEIAPDAPLKNELGLSYSLLFKNFTLN